MASNILLKLPPGGLQVLGAFTTCHRRTGRLLTKCNGSRPRTKQLSYCLNVETKMRGLQWTRNSLAASDSRDWLLPEDKIYIHTDMLTRKIKGKLGATRTSSGIQLLWEDLHDKITLTFHSLRSSIHLLNRSVYAH